VATVMAEAGAERVLFELNTNDTCADPSPASENLPVGTADFSYEVATTLVPLSGACDVEAIGRYQVSGGGTTLSSRFVRFRATGDNGFNYAAQAGYGGVNITGSITLVSAEAEANCITPDLPALPDPTATCFAQYAPADVFSNGVFTSSGAAVTVAGSIFAADDCVTYKEQTGSDPCAVGAYPTTNCSGQCSSRPDHVTVNLGTAQVVRQVFSKYEFDASSSVQPLEIPAPGAFPDLDCPLPPSGTGIKNTVAPHRAGSKACEQEDNAQPRLLPVIDTRNQIDSWTDDLGKKSPPTTGPNRCVPGQTYQLTGGTEDWGGSNQFNFFNCNVSILSNGAVSIHGPIHITGTFSVSGSGSVTMASDHGSEITTTNDDGDTNSAIFNANQLIVVDRTVSFSGTWVFSGHTPIPPDNHFLIVVSRACGTSGPSLGCYAAATPAPPTSADQYLVDVWQDEVISVTGGGASTVVGVYAPYATVGMSGGSVLNLIVGQRITMGGSGVIVFNKPSGGGGGTWVPTGYTLSSS